MNGSHKTLGVFIVGITFIISLCFPRSIFAVDSTGVWEQVGSLSVPRTVPGVALLQNGKVIVSGGYNGVILKSTEIYDPITKAWSMAGDMNVSRMLAISPGMVTLSDGRIVVTNGEGPNLAPLSSTEIYSPLTNTWASVSSSSIGRFRAVVASLPDGKILLATGKIGGGINNSAEIYSPLTNTWAMTGNMNIGREGQGNVAILNDGRVMIAGGRSNNKFAENTAEIYDPSTGQWVLSVMPYNMNHGTLTTLQDGRVLSVGSYNGVVALASTAIYDPTANIWTSAASLPAPRAGHTSILLSDGNVLVFGGDDLGFYYNETAIYNPSTDTWVSGPSLPTSMTAGVTIKLLNGDYLVAGGYNGSIRLASSYLFTTAGLKVPLLKQTDSLWANDIYDSAQGWFSQDPTIGRWGCALTSAAMVFKYHGLDKLPDGTTDLRPNTLNTWLLAQPDGYVGNGLVNWLALTRLSKLASPFNSQFDHDALEFSRINGENKAQLTQDLQNGIPDILEVPGHFVVAKGEAGATFKINDPFYSHTDLTSYLNSFFSLSRFIPSNTDLSYIMAVVNSDVDIILKNSSNQIVGESFIQNPISLDGVNKSGSPVKILYFKKPQGGDYLFTLTGNTSNNYFIKTFLYDENGNVKVSTDNGIVGPNDTDQYSINFNKVNSENSSSVHNVTFDSFIQDINSLFNAKKINFPTYMSVSSQAKVAKNLSGNLLTRQGVIQILKSIDKELLKKLDKGVSENAYSILHSGIQTLLASL